MVVPGGEEQGQMSGGRSTPDGEARVAAASGQRGEGRSRGQGLSRSTRTAGWILSKLTCPWRFRAEE